MTTAKCCGTCRFQGNAEEERRQFTGMYTDPIHNPPMRPCKRYPPRVAEDESIAMTSGPPGWRYRHTQPMMRAEDWCGEWRPL